MKWVIVFGLLSCVALAHAKQPNSPVDEYSSDSAMPLPCGVYCKKKPKPPLACGDYLKQYGHSRPDVQYIGCKPVLVGGQGVPSFEAEYRVKGVDIEKVDNWLATWTDWEHLRFSCCQWDAPTGFYRDKSGATFDVDMGADAWVNGHMLDSRSDFAKIPYASLRLTHMLYTP